MSCFMYALFTKNRELLLFVLEVLDYLIIQIIESSRLLVSISFSFG